MPAHFAYFCVAKVRLRFAVAKQRSYFVIFWVKPKVRKCFATAKISGAKGAAQNDRLNKPLTIVIIF
jgi:hypothetical protein